MLDHLEAILFDIGGTLRGSIKVDPASRPEEIRGIQQLIGDQSPIEEFTAVLVQRAKAYHDWALETYIELDEYGQWIQWMLPDRPVAQIGPLAMQLNHFWRRATGERPIFPDTREVVLELFRRGYRLGVVSNTISSVETPRDIKEMQLAGCFETVILSCVVGKRKPSAEIMLEATARMGIDPARCAYIGDRVKRDVVSSRKAGINKVILVRDEKHPEEQTSVDPALQPDMIVEDLRELLDIFPPKTQEFAPKANYKLSLSTMWAIRNFPGLPDFFEAARRLGFEGVELNHMVDSSMLNGFDLSKFNFSSVHEPCPADISTEKLKEEDWLISSPVESKRIKGRDTIIRSIDLAHQLGAKAIVIHCGTIPGYVEDEQSLKDLFDAGEAGSDEYLLIKETLINSRTERAGQYLEAVKKSLRELIEYASQFDIRLGLENRYHYYDIPTLDEMEELLVLGTPDQLGFIYDVGHAQVLDRLGFFAHEEWLRRYAGSMIGTHLHDVIGVDDHLMPGLGEVDFDMIASYLPKDAYRALEIQPFNSFEQIMAGLRLLVEKECI